ncbi:unnamed protein product [Blepharisma stoltei]|uniref:Leucine Rich Repeat family protein n=1 Tax=Blepharisma stoltei TaxID=1481888 RepID=A0AAU9IVQ5_9CILI|nr:unnamed protein product [Blepharisma stoltei]
MEESSYKDICKANNVQEIKEINDALISREKTISITTNRLLKDKDFYCLSETLLQSSDLGFLKSIEIHNQNLSVDACKFLYLGLKENLNIMHLNLNSNFNLNTNSMTYINFLLLENTTIEVLDLSDNNLHDGSIFELSNIAKDIRLKALILDSNEIKDSEIWQGLSINEFIEEFSISYNPLTFDCIACILDMLINNKALKYLGINGVDLSDPAPIKENHHGFLTMHEALIFQLANVLRYSGLSIVGIDIDPMDILALEELECTLVKYNHFLTAIVSESINWLKLPPGSPLIRIFRALKANTRINKDFYLPKYIKNPQHQDLFRFLEVLRLRNGETISYYDSNSSDYVRIEEESAKKMPETPQFSLSQGKINFDIDLSDDESIVNDLCRKKLERVSLLNEVKPINEMIQKTIITEETPQSSIITTPKAENRSYISEKSHIINSQSPYASDGLKGDQIMENFQNIIQAIEKFDGKLEDLSTRVNRIEIAVNSLQNEVVLNKNEKSQEIAEISQKIAEISDKKKEFIKTRTKNDKAINALTERITEIEAEQKKFSATKAEIDKSLNLLSQKITKVTRVQSELISQQKNEEYQQPVSSRTQKSSENKIIKPFKPPTKLRISTKENVKTNSSDESTINEEISKLEAEIKYGAFDYVEQEKFNKDVKRRLLTLENNEKKLSKIKELTQNLQAELKSKLSRLDENLRTAEEYNHANKSILYSINELEKSMHILNHKVFKEISNIKDSFMIEYKDPASTNEKFDTSKQRNTFDPKSFYKTNQSTFQGKSRDSSMIKNNPIKIPKKPEEFGSIKQNQYERYKGEVLKNDEIDDSFDERLMRLDKSIQKTPTSDKSIQSPEKSFITDLSDVFPSEAESIMLNVMLDKIDKNRKVASNYSSFYKNNVSNYD